MYTFLNDYNELAHENLLKAIMENNYALDDGYGRDKFCEKAREIIREKFDCKNADIHFFMAGTQTNIAFISHVLRNFEAVIATDIGHINAHEVTAIEGNGHKILTAPNKDGKLLPEDIEKICKKNLSDDHTAYPKMVFISDATEIGTVYTKQELIDIHNMCKKYNLYLYIDGARLGTAMTSKYSDIDIKDLAKYSDAFYISGTKNGALFGEALVINNDDLKPNFFRQMKSKGALHSKGKIMGIEFIELFKGNLYFEMATHANEMAYKIYDALKDKYEFYTKVESNQLFMVLDNNTLEKLGKKFAYGISEVLDENRTCIRLVTSWATKESKVDELIEYLS